MKKVLRYSLISTTIYLSACSSIDNSVINSTLDIPKLNRSNMTPSLSCANNIIAKNNALPTLAVVEDFSDGTLTSKTLADGELTDSGKELFKHALSSTISSKYLTIPYNDLNGFQLANEYGVSKIAPQTLGKVYNVKRVFRIKGKFTKLDGNATYDKGYAGNIGYNHDSDSSDFRFGKTKNSRSLSLTVFLASASNVVLDSATFDITIRKAANNFTATLKVSNGSGGYNYSKTVSESLHNAQQLLTEAAAYWFVTRVFPADYNSCMKNSYSPEKISSLMREWRKSSESEKIKKIQTILYNGGLLNKNEITSHYDAKTKKAVSEFEKITGTIFPHNEYNLDHLYLLLLTSSEEA